MDLPEDDAAEPRQSRQEDGSQESTDSNNSVTVRLIRALKKSRFINNNTFEAKLDISVHNLERISKLYWKYWNFILVENWRFPFVTVLCRIRKKVKIFKKETYENLNII